MAPNPTNDGDIHVSIDNDKEIVETAIYRLYHKLGYTISYDNLCRWYQNLGYFAKFMSFNCISND